MTVLWVLGILLCAVLILCQLRIGVQVVYQGGTVRVDVRLGPVSFPIVSPQERPQKAEAQPAEQSGAQSAERTGRTLPKIGLEDVRDAAAALWQPLKRALDRTRRGIRIDPFRISLILGGAADPAETAERYGYLQAAIWTGMPVLERILQIPDPQIHTDIDFDAGNTVMEIRLRISARIGTLLGVAAGIAVPVIRWFLNVRKKQAKTAPARQPAA